MMSLSFNDQSEFEEPDSTAFRASTSDVAFSFLFFLWTAAQINENLATNPQLLLDKPETEGYIGIVLQRLGDSDVAHPQHLNQSDYDNL